MAIFSLIALVVSVRSAFQTSGPDLICYNTIYEGDLIDKTAKEACDLRSQKEDSRPDCRYCLTRISSYKENDFPINEPGQLLKYPLAKRSFGQKGDYHVIILWNRIVGTCRAVGAIYEVSGLGTQKCNKIRYTGWGNEFVIDDDDACTQERKLGRLPSIAECGNY